MKSKLYLVKIGGAILEDEIALKNFLSQFAKIDALKILVHGGGRLASELGIKLGMPPKMVNGRRITDAETLKIACMVYGGLTNKTLVANLQALGVNAIGLTGADANILPAKKRVAAEIDYGFAGDIEEGFDTSSLRYLVNGNFVPVIASLTHDGKGQLLNTNADTIAAALAAALSKDYSTELIFCFEKRGVMVNAQDEASLIPHLNQEEYANLREGKIVSNGMLPKLDNAFDALEKGVGSIFIGKAENLNLMLEKEENAGTRLII